LHGEVIYKGFWRKGKKHGKGEFKEEGEKKFKEAMFCDGELLHLIDNK